MRVGEIVRLHMFAKKLLRRIEDAIDAGRATAGKPQLNGSVLVVGRSQRGIVIDRCRSQFLERIKDFFPSHKGAPGSEPKRRVALEDIGKGVEEHIDDPTGGIARGAGTEDWQDDIRTRSQSVAEHGLPEICVMFLEADELGDVE